jgi:hypothetical protein
MPNGLAGLLQGLWPRRKRVGEEASRV